jgi:predicted RNase H-like nuclease (RuvC/YqgF family)
VTEWIIEHGRPVVVAADVTPMPETVEKLRRSFDAAGWTPERDLPVDVKQHRTREEGYDNDHERDAMAAAFGAFDHHTDQFDRIAAKVPPGEDVGPVVARVVASEESVESVLADLRDDGGEESDDAGHEPNEQTPEQRRISDLETQVERLQSHVDRLEATIEDKDDQLDEYEQKLTAARSEQRREARRDREVTRLQRENRRLESELDERDERIDDLAGKLERLKTLWKLDHSNFADVSEKREGLVPVKVVDQFTSGAIDDADERFGLAEDDVVMFRDASGAGASTADKIVDLDPRIVLRNGGLSDIADEILFKHDVPVAPADLVTVQEVDELAVAREEEIETAIDDWERRARQRERERNAEMVDRLISEHRADRGESD